MAAALGVGIIGTGAIARSHVQGYQAWPGDCRIVAVADIAADKAQALSAELGGIHWYTDYNDLLNQPDVDIVSVCTPPYTHAPITVAALRAGKHVICEKPMAASLEEADQMIAAAEASGKVLSVVFQKRFFPEFWRAKAVTESGLLGHLVFGKCEALWFRGRTYYDLWWRGTWEMECGGATINHAIHDIDAFLWYMGEPVSVYAEMDALAHDIEVEDVSVAVVRFAGGALGQVTSTVNCHQNKTVIEVSGEDASVSIPWALAARVSDDDGFSRRDNGELLQRLAERADAVSVPPGQGHGAQFADVFRAIRTGTKPLVDGSEGRRVLEFITGLYRSASTGQKVTFPLSPGDPFYTTEGLRAHVKRHASSKTGRPKL